MHTSTSQSDFTEARMQVLDGTRVSLPPRQQLLDRLFEETDGATAGKRLTLFLAPVGYGKTSTVASWLGDGTESEEPVRWIDCATIRPRDLWQAVTDQVGQFTAGAPAPAPEVRSQIDAIHFATTLWRPMTLVIDSYHYATSPANDIALAQLSGASPLLSLVVIARRVSVLAGPLVTAETRVLIVGPDDLAFTLDEQHELAQALGIEPSDGLDIAFNQSGGWPLATRAALNIGSDRQHLAVQQPPPSGDPHTHQVLDPVANLHSFALNYLELTTPSARKVLLAAALIDAISLTLIEQATNLGTDVARSALHELLELGLLREVSAPTGFHYRCHRSIRGALSPLAQQAFTLAERHQVYIGRAREIEPTAPLAAFTLFCQAEAFTAAEHTLARNFTTITNEVEVSGNTLRAIPEAVQREHPTFTAALLFLETPNPAVAPSTLGYLTSLWIQTLQERLPDNRPAESDPIFLQLLCQAMVATRITGQIETSISLMRTLESRLTPGQVTGGTAMVTGGPISNTEPSLNGSLPTYYRELASTALAFHDFVRARRYLEQLRDHSLRQISATWRGFGYAASRTVTAPQSGSRWLLAALSELAFTELIDGDMRSCARLVAEMDSHASQSGESAPGISWVGAEIARAHLACELADPGMLAVAAARLEPVRDRLEREALLLMAEVAVLRSQRGADWALSHLRSAISSETAEHSPQGEWREPFTAFHAMLCTTTGNLAQAEALLGQCTEESAPIRIEQARLALYSGDDVTALLIARSIGDPETTKRQRVDRDLLATVAAWNCNQPESAFSALAHAAGGIKKFGLYTELQGVPHEMLAAAVIAAQEAGVCDLTEFVDAVPEPARSVRYDRLTEMEHQTLIAIYEHRNANQAAASLHVTPGTVKKHLVSVYKKLRVKGRDEAILQAGRMGLL